MKPYYQDDAVTIYHGDSRAVLSTMADASVDLILTDPPYGHNNNNDGDLAHRWEEALGLVKRGRALPGVARPIAGDSADETAELVQWLFRESRRLLVPGGCCCCCCGGGGGPDPQFARWALWMDQALGFKQAVVWDKGGLGMGWHYRRNYEFVLVGEKPGAPCKWYGGDSVANVIRLTGLKPGKNDHPTPKPVDLFRRFILWHSRPDELVVDPFMGGGTTLRAAKDLGRRAIGIDVEERWCEMAALRLQQEVLGLSA